MLEKYFCIKYKSHFLNCQYLGFLKTNFTFLLCSHKILANAVEWQNSENVSCALGHTPHVTDSKCQEKL